MYTWILPTICERDYCCLKVILLSKFVYCGLYLFINEHTRVQIFIRFLYVDVYTYLHVTGFLQIHTSFFIIPIIDFLQISEEVYYDIDDPTMQGSLLCKDRDPCLCCTVIISTTAVRRNTSIQDPKRSLVIAISVNHTYRLREFQTGWNPPPPR